MDVQQRRVPNWALVPVAVAVLMWQLLQGGTTYRDALVPSLLGGMIGIVFWLPGYWLRRTGAGDVKFAVVMGLLLGPIPALEANLVALVMLGAYALPSAYAGHYENRIPAVPALAFGLIVELIGGPWWLGQGGF